jgi:hypothetical protein
MGGEGEIEADWVRSTMLSMPSCPSGWGGRYWESSCRYEELRMLAPREGRLPLMGFVVVVVVFSEDMMRAVRRGRGELRVVVQERGKGSVG